MCILFVYAGTTPSPDSYKVIMAVNRDEMYNRPTQVAGFWSSPANILGGRDMEPGREGGTWLAISKKGRIGTLLNILQSREALATAATRKGRGFLVNDLLKAEDSMEYLNSIYRTSGDYNPFSLVSVDFAGVPQIRYYSLAEPDQKPRQLPTGSGLVHGVGNSFIEIPFRKVKSGQAAFSKVVQELNSISKREDLIKGILGVMKNDELHHPDEQIEAQAADQPETYKRGLSRRFIKLAGYGTRTHTIILVDWNNHVFYREITMEEPINEQNPKWQTSTFEFEINAKQ